MTEPKCTLHAISLVEQRKVQALVSVRQLWNFTRILSAPIGGWNGIWIYGTSDVIAENNTIENTGKEAVLIGEYHYQDTGWQVPAPSAARLYLANNMIRENAGTCNSQMYGGDFPLPGSSRLPLFCINS